MSDEEANNSTESDQVRQWRSRTIKEGDTRLPSTGTIVKETILNERCNNPKCYCNERKRDEERRSISLLCMFGFHDYHLPLNQSYYKCRRCGEEPAYGP